MIKPSECRPRNAKPDRHDAHMVMLEERIDLCIRHADDTGQWPARVDPLQIQIADYTLHVITEEYRAQGWQVELQPRGSAVLMLVDLPPA